MNKRTIIKLISYICNMKELEIQKLIRKDGLYDTIINLNLYNREVDDLILIQYKMIDADWTNPATHECRGIILDKSNNYELVAFPYEKFWNLGEIYAADIDWDSAEVYDKLDGTMINAYYYKGEWKYQTTGSPDASGETYINKTFKDLVYETVTIMYGSVENFENKLNKDYNYMFELCTPYNIVVVPHKESTMILHGIRDMKTLDFVSLNTVTDLVCVKRHNINDVETIHNFISEMPWTEEGFVVVDKNFNRIKIKNPSYIAVHHTATKSSPYAIMNVIKENDIEEFLLYFKQHTDEIKALKQEWDKTINYIESFYDTVKDIESNKDFAFAIRKIEKKYRGILFNIRNGKCESVHEALCTFNNKELYNNMMVNGKVEFKTNFNSI